MTLLRGSNRHPVSLIAISALSLNQGFITLIFSYLLIKYTSLEEASNYFYILSWVGIFSIIIISCYESYIINSPNKIANRKSIHTLVIFFIVVISILSPLFISEHDILYFFSALTVVAAYSCRHVMSLLSGIFINTHLRVSFDIISLVILSITVLIYLSSSLPVAGYYFMLLYGVSVSIAFIICFEYIDLPQDASEKNETDSFIPPESKNIMVAERIFNNIASNSVVIVFGFFGSVLGVLLWSLYSKFFLSPFTSMFHSIWSRMHTLNLDSRAELQLFLLKMLIWCSSVGIVLVSTTIWFSDEVRSFLQLSFVSKIEFNMLLILFFLHGIVFGLFSIWYVPCVRMDWLIGLGISVANVLTILIGGAMLALSVKVFYAVVLILGADCFFKSAYLVYQRNKIVG